ncbi:MAG: hypothetical protein DLM55_09605 [Acidimicrobiales bacterium]|nr:MAG: hypothetical protein DLM55_09605 [Acidimicrobiales bacterium]
MSNNPSTLPDDHESFAELAAGWALYALDAQDRAAFALHLPICPPCQEAVAEFTEAISGFAAQIPDVAPPPQVWERIRAVALESAPDATSVRLASSDGSTVGRVLVHGQHLQVLAEGLPRNRVRKATYVLWSLPHGEGAPPRALTPFDVDERGAVIGGAGELGAELASISAFAVSFERGRVMPKAPSKVVASGAVAGSGG